MKNIVDKLAVKNGSFANFSYDDYEVSAFFFVVFLILLHFLIIFLIRLILERLFCLS